MIRSRKLPVSPRTLRDALEHLGPVYVKIGQYLALRPDLLPQEYCDELLELVDSAAFFAWEQARLILLEDLGPNALELYTGFQMTPVAAASLAQVYLAETLQGDIVAVKVQRPGVREEIDRDFAQARAVQPLVDLFQLIPGVSFREVLDEMRTWIYGELDFVRERNNMKRMRELLRDDYRVRIPNAFDELSGRRVITMEYLAGVGFAQLRRLVQAGNTAAIREMDLDPDVLAESLLRSSLDQVFRHEFFHADLHPGNLVALKASVVGFLDFGLTETLDQEYEPGVRRFVSAAYLDNIEGMLDAFVPLLIQEENADVPAFKAEFRKLHRIWMRRRLESNGNSHLRNYMIGVLRAARPCGLRVPASLLSIYRSLLTAETVAGQLGSQADLVSVGRSFFVGLRAERLLDQFQPKEIERGLIPWLDLLEEPREKYFRFLSDVADGRYVLGVESTEAPASRRAANQRTRLITIAILVVAISILVAGSRGILSEVLWGLWGALAVWLIVLWRRLK